MKYLLLLTLLVACSATHPGPLTVLTVHHDSPRISLAFHGDVDFTPAERAVIAAAMDALMYQTAGMYIVTVKYDLDFKDMTSVERWAKSPALIRAESTFPWIQILEIGNCAVGGSVERDEGDGGCGHILGLTMPEDRKVFLIQDRLTDLGLMLHVTMHELLHAAGLQHVAGPGSVMSAAVCGLEGNKVVCPHIKCLTPADAAEFCRVQHCQPADLNACPWPV